MPSGGAKRLFSSSEHDLSVNALELGIGCQRLAEVEMEPYNYSSWPHERLYSGDDFWELPQLLGLEIDNAQVELRPRVQRFMEQARGYSRNGDPGIRSRQIGNPVCDSGAVADE
jgi:hypothetical protein